MWSSHFTDEELGGGSPTLTHDGHEGSLPLGSSPPAGILPLGSQAFAPSLLLASYSGTH